jgi:uncharacterized membrane protein YphA (DoxX/SURF4 family)
MTTAYHHTPHPAHHHDSRSLIDRVAADYGNALWLVRRILIGGIFVQSGLEKLMDLNGIAAMLAGGGVPVASAGRRSQEHNPVWPTETSGGRAFLRGRAFLLRLGRTGRLGRALNRI